MAYKRSRALAPLIGLLVLIVALAGAVAAGSKWGNASWTPKLALDLDGGTQIVLTPQVQPGQKVTNSAVQEAINIIRLRVNSTGVSEAEVTKQGANNIVVALPGDPKDQAEAIRLVSQSAQAGFRPVLALEPTGQGAAAPGASSSSGKASSSSGKASSSSGSTSNSSSSTTKTNNARVPGALRTARPAVKAADSTPEPTFGSVPGDPSPSSTQDPSAAETQALQKRFQTLDCSKPENRTGGTESNPSKPLVACAQDGSAKYALGPVALKGQQVKSVSVAPNQDQRGNQLSDWVVQMTVVPDMVKKYETITKQLVGQQAPMNQMALVMDDLVVTAPQQTGVITNGNAQITGNFTNKEASTLASQLKFGALPMTFKVQTQQQISALLGSEQLRGGLIAGLIGLVLVGLYSLLQYRGLGLVTIASLVIAAVVTYLMLLVLSWTQGYRLSLSGVAGTIVAIGVTADSFIVYFERIRDEVRSGRALTSAVERGWKRARQTILVSDVINLLAAVVLYFLSVGSVRGFAYTLGLTTLIDLVVVMLFTHPVMQLLARVPFFNSGHPWSGFSADQLGRPTSYVGRGRVRTPPGRRSVKAKAEQAGDEPASEDDAPATTDDGRPMTIAERKAAAARAARQQGQASGGSTTALASREGDDDESTEA